MAGHEVLDILIYGYYNKNNYGDDLFKETFIKLFPDLKLGFTSDPRDFILKSYKYVIIGGGNVVHNDIYPYIDFIVQRTGFDVWSVSIATPDEAKLIEKANAVIVRDYDSIQQCRTTSIKRIEYAPDMVFTNTAECLNAREGKREKVAIVTNANLIPTHECSISKWQEYQRFVCETARFIDEHSELWFDFISFQTTPHMDDSIMSTAIYGATKRKKATGYKNPFREQKWSSFKSVDYKAIITTRYHGAVLGIMSSTPTIPICFHSKMSNFVELHELNGVNYYEFSKGVLENQLHKALNAVPTVLDLNKKIILSNTRTYHERANELIQHIQQK